jgi:synaptobrevin family protein YKT6
MCYARVCGNGLGVAVVSDQEYPARVVFDLIQAALDLFNNCCDETIWKNLTSDTELTVKGLDDLLIKYQKPEEVDKIAKINKELNETKEILHANINQLMKRGEKIESLVDKSNDLSFQSRIFLKKGKELNSCCVIL